QWSAPTAYVPTSYQVYFGTNASVLSNPMSAVTTNRFTPPAAMNYDTMYYWTVIAYNGATPYPGETWSFRTGLNSQFRLAVDFALPGGVVAANWQGYFAQQETLSSFTAQNYAAFGTTVTVTPTWAPGAVNAAVQMHDRGGNDGTDAEDL